MEEIYTARARQRQLSKLKDVKDTLPLASIDTNGKTEEKGRVTEIISKKTGNRLSPRIYERAKTIIKHGTQEQTERYTLRISFR